jgi:hypothetical protein
VPGVSLLLLLLLLEVMWSVLGLLRWNQFRNSSSDIQ